MLAATETTYADAFGLNLELTFPIVGLSAGTPGARAVRVERVSGDALAVDWTGASVKRLSTMLLPDGRIGMTVDAGADGAHLLGSDYFGSYDISADASLIRCVPPDLADWDWQRLMTSRVLPMVASLRGLEVFHASAVALGGRAAAFVGPSGAGKTSLSTQLRLRGAGFLTDDVVATEIVDGTVVAHPGPRIAAIRPDLDASLAAGDQAQVGEVVGSEYKTYRTVEADSRELPLGALYYLERSAPVDGVTFERLESPDPRLLLSSTFEGIFDSPARLLRQLEVCSLIARSVPIFVARAPESCGPAEFAEATEEHFERSA